jgi:hypothetical protein
MRPFAVLLVFAAAPFAPADAPKRDPDVERVFRELDLPPTEPAFGGLAKGYEADAVTEAEVRNNAKKYPVRMKVLEALDALSAARRITAEEMIVSGLDDTTKKAIRDRQEVLATSIAELEEAATALTAVADARRAETKRWQAHYDFVLAECRLRIVTLTIQNAAYGQVIIEHLPELNPKAGQNGWRLVPTDRLPGGAIKKTAAAALAEMKDLTATYEKTPWGKAAERAVAKPIGLTWEPTKLALRD